MSGWHTAPRRAVPADAAEVGEVVNAAYRSFAIRINRPPGPMLDDYAKRIAGDQVWVLDQAGRIVGVLVLEETPNRFLLDNVAVLPEFQQLGVGRVLLIFAEQEARRRGRDEIVLYTNALMTENIALYRRIGYVETARVAEKGFDRVYMSKQLRFDK